MTRRELIALARKAAKRTCRALNRRGKEDALAAGWLRKWEAGDDAYRADFEGILDQIIEGAKEDAKAMVEKVSEN